MKQERVLEPTDDVFRDVEEHKDALYVQIKDLLTADPQPDDEAFLMEKIQGYSPTRLVAKYLHLNEQMMGSSKEEINEVFAQLVDIETRHYAAEFLYRSPVLQTEYAVRNINGVPSVVMPQYDERAPLHTHISLKERDGATFYGVLNLERALLEATEHSTVVYASSSGWNGTGEPFTEAQVHAVNIVDGQIIDTVLRVSLTPQETQMLVENLSTQKLTGKSEIERIKEMSQMVISFPYDIPADELLLKIKQIKGTQTAWERMKQVNNKPVFDKKFTFEEVENVLRQESFLATNAEVNRIIEELDQYLIQNSNMDPTSLREMVRHIGKAALIISESIGFEVGEITERKTQNGDYREATKYASEGLGCAPTLSESREAQYAREGIDKTCSQCGEYAKTLCDWCIKCAAAGGNYKKAKQETVMQGYEVLQQEDIAGSFIGAIIKGALMVFSKN